ncbi:MAG: hypothetical protein HC850_04365 [Rhodomicrobium sp.]|nr:hypothetical protein [Rhodomicrobium sp.]
MIRVPSIRLGGFNAFLGELEEQAGALADREAGGLDPSCRSRSSPPGWHASMSVTLTLGHLRRGEASHSPSVCVSEPYREALEGSAGGWRPEEDCIAGELGLDPAMSRDDILRVRRAFALRNHPDRFPPALRAEAHRRMALANKHFDDALCRSSSSAPR